MFARSWKIPEKKKVYPTKCSEFLWKHKSRAQAAVPHLWDRQGNTHQYFDVYILFFIWLLELFPTNIIADMSLADLKFKVIFLFASGVFSASLLFLDPSVSFHLCPFGLVPLLYEAKHLSFNLNFIFKKWKKWQGRKSGMWSRWWAKLFKSPWAGTWKDFAAHHSSPCFGSMFSPDSSGLSRSPRNQSHPGGNNSLWTAKWSLEKSDTGCSLADVLPFGLGNSGFFKTTGGPALQLQTETHLWRRNNEHAGLCLDMPETITLNWRWEIWNRVFRDVLPELSDQTSIKHHL